MSINVIKSILENEGMNLLIDFNELETENYFKPLGHATDNVSYDSNDTRYILNQRKINIWRFLKKIGATIEYIKSGTTGHAFKGQIVKNNQIEYTFAVKVSAYQKRNTYGEVTNLARPENAEIMMLRVLSYFIATKQTPHLIIPIQTFYTDIKFFLLLSKYGHIKTDVKRYNEFIQRYENGKYEDTVSILLSEWANKGDFSEFVRNRYKNFQLKHWKVFFFQILSVLAVIQSKYPSFRHNDMKANNILVHKLATCHKKTQNLYTICGKLYIVPNIGYQIKLWDFDFACIPGIVDNIKVTEEWTRELNITSVKNQYYDMHYFFNTLTNKGFIPEIQNDTTHIPNEIREFINRVVPHQYKTGHRVSEKGRLLIDDEYTSPQKILETDIFFKEFRRISQLN